MRFLSLFSGIEAASVAWLLLGWECAAVAEVDRFPCTVLAHHYPEVPNLGDVTKITKDQISALGHIDVVVFGSPCQDVSIAGRRAGLIDSAGQRTRSGLFFNAMQIVEWTNAEWIVFENVPGLISSNKGEDFNLVLDSFESLGYHVEVDICDAQFFGVPQRRRRVFAVCHKLAAGLKRKTLLSAVITLKLLFSIWQQSWEEATRRSKAESYTSTFDARKRGHRNKKTTSEPISKANPIENLLSISTEVCVPLKVNGSDSASTAKDCAAGLQKRINLFETLLSKLSDSNTEPASLETLLSILDETFQSSLNEPKNLDAVSAQPTNETPSDAGIDESAAAQASWSLSTLPLWKAVLDAGYILLNESTTSTESSRTIETITYTYAKTLLSIAESTASLLGLLPNSWREELSLSTMIQDVMKFAKERLKNGSPNIEISNRKAESICNWLLVLQQAEHQNLVIRNLGDRRCSPTLLPFTESLRGDTPPRREEREIAPTIPARRTSDGGLGTDWDCDGGLRVVYDSGIPMQRVQGDEQYGLVADMRMVRPWTRHSKRVIVSHDPACTLTAREFKGPLPEADLSTVVASSTGAGYWREGLGPLRGRTQDSHENLAAHSLRADGFDASEDGTGRGTPLVPVAFAQNTRDEVRLLGGDGLITGALAAEPGMKQQTYVAFSCKDSGADAGDITPTLRSMNFSDSHANAGGQVAVAYVPVVGQTLTSGGKGERGRMDPVNTDLIAFNLRGREGGSPPEPCDQASLRSTGGGSSRSYVMCDTFNKEGITRGCAQKIDAVALLRVLQDKIGEKTFAQWGLGILNSLQQTQILQQALYGLGIRPAPFSRSWVVYCTLSREKGNTAWLLQSLREAQCEGCASPGWEPSKQYAEQLGAYLSKLSQPGAQNQKFMRDLWETSERFGLLRQALSTIQEMGKSPNDKTQSASSPYAVRRLTAEECEFLQGFPRGYTKINDKTADGPRYKALGNSFAVPVVRWIGRRIQLVAGID